MKNQKHPLPLLTTGQFLEQFPWGADEVTEGKPLDFLWHFDLEATPAELWPHLIDTSTFNKLLDLPVMNFKEQNGVLYGESVNAGIKLKWREVPWQWEHQRTLNNARVYSEGFAHYVRARYLLEPLDEKTTRFYVYFGWVPRGLKGKLVLKLGFNSVRQKYQKVLKKIVHTIHENQAFAQQQKHLYQQTNQVQLSPGAAEKIQTIRSQLLQRNQPENLVDQLLSYVQSASDEELVRIRAKRLARDLNIPLKQLLETMLHATVLGLFYLSWDIICPHCRGVRDEVKSLGDLVESAECQVCDIEFDTTDLNTLEITFHVHESIRKVEQKFFCAAEPATKRHIYVQRIVKPGQQYQVHSLPGNSVYRIRLQGEKKYRQLSLQEGSGESAVSWVVPGNETDLQGDSQAVLTLQNQADSEQTFIIEKRQEDEEALRPQDLFTFQKFRDLFASEALATGIQLQVGTQTIMFTDIVGSSRLYGEAGDAKAFQNVRNHFIKVYQVVEKFDGAVVKTIGDAAMVAFSSATAAMQAAIELQKQFHHEDENNVLIRLSLHTGKVLAVNLNSNIDYFGQTVNMAAKLQNYADAREIAFSQQLFDNQAIQQLLRASQVKVTRKTDSPSWANGEINIYRVKPG